jgi:hypothetical protein
LSLDSILDFSLLAAGNTFRFADSAAVSWNAGQTLKVYNYTSGTDHLYVGTDGAGLTTGQLDAIQFYSDNGVTLLNSGFAPQFIGAGEVGPYVVPEPSSLLLTAGLFGLAGWRERRRSASRRFLARAAQKHSHIQSTHNPPTQTIHP